MNNVRKNEDQRVKDFIIKDSKYLNKIFYVCDFRRSIQQDRAFRDLKPTQVMLVRNEVYQEELIKMDEKLIPKKICFSENVFISLKKNGELNYKKHIPIFDNTGHSVYDSFALFVFDTEDEAKNKYNELLDVYIAELEVEEKIVLKKISDKILDAKNRRF